MDWDFFIHQLIRVAQRKRGGPITHRSQDRNLALIYKSVAFLFLFFQITKETKAIMDLKNAPNYFLDWDFLFLYELMREWCSGSIVAFIFIWSNQSGAAETWWFISIWTNQSGAAEAWLAHNSQIPWSMYAFNQIKDWDRGCTEAWWAHNPQVLLVFSITKESKAISSQGMYSKNGLRFLFLFFMN